jgi:fatty-acyl-CoA synthase
MGATIVCLPRWDPAAAGYMIERYGCTHWANVPTMVADLLSHPPSRRAICRRCRTCSAADRRCRRPWRRRLFERCGIEYMEGYGMTETISQTHMNPPGHLRKQCLGIPTFDTESLVIDPESLRPLGPTSAARSCHPGRRCSPAIGTIPRRRRRRSAEIDGRRFLRTGDLGYYDDDGYFYIADRLKRMINVAGFKVWPAKSRCRSTRIPTFRKWRSCRRRCAMRRSGQSVCRLKPQSRDR